MVERAAERLCASPQRWLIVTGVTFLIALATMLPQVDLLLAEQSERAELEEQLKKAEETAKTLPLYVERFEEKSAELARLHEREVEEEQLPTLRSWLVNAARQSGCQVRRIDLGSPTKRPWTDNDDPLHASEKGKKASNSPFQLETRSVAFSVTGAIPDILALLKTLDSDNRLKHAQSASLKPASRGAHELQLDLTLWYFALVHKKGVA